MKPMEIKTIRLDMGLTQQEFSNIFPVTIATLSRWENGVNAPSKMVIKRLKQLKDEIAK